MKSNVKLKIIFLITIGILFTFLPLFSSYFIFNARNNKTSSKYSHDFDLDNENLKTSAVSGRIHIINNWSAAKAVGICTGSGTYSEPYIIEDLVIDGGGSGSCILIENSYSNFKIENCTVFNSGTTASSAGIKLINVQRSQLIDNNCSSNLVGIWIHKSYSITVSGNIVNDNSFGIYLYDSNGNAISENTAINNSLIGIYLYYSDRNNLSGNTANYNSFGIYLYNSDRNLISRNIVSNNFNHGISQYFSYYNTITENTANYNSYGIYVKGSYYNTISRNTANNNSVAVIYLTFSTGNDIWGNYASYNAFGIYIHSSNGNTISGNTAINNSLTGIHLYYSDYNNISGNTANYNSFGIYLSHSKYDNISENTANYNSVAGIYLNASGNDVWGNNAKYNFYGIYLHNSNYTTLSGNTLIGNDICILEVNCTGNQFSNNEYCDYGEDEDGGIPFDMIFLISIISGGAVIGIANTLLNRLKRKRIELVTLLLYI
ncbi:MAG: right-handed parallel beta-helix repeat-containing protein [Candidatus Lokiarchaeota archaeon]|nr:right-handed parallel beta-helix repeat-containing protein [Candidatus Lokiarchaeota archaeon]